MSRVILAISSTYRACYPITPTFFLLCTNEEAKFQCAYLHHDKNDKEWVCSGSKAGVPDKEFSDCNKEHFCPPSTFYDTFPARDSLQASQVGSSIWEYLEEHVADGFNPSDPIISEFKKDYNDGGLCFFTHAEIQRVAKSICMAEKSLTNLFLWWRLSSI